MASNARSVGGEVQVIRVLRCQKTRRFFSPEGWSEDAERAETFADQIAAVDACLAHQLADVEMVIRVEGSRTDLFCTPLR